MITALSDAGSRTHVLVLSAFNDSMQVYDAISAGARGYVTKDADRQTRVLARMGRAT